MIIFYNHQQPQHHGQFEMFRGAMVPCHEVPARADHVLAELGRRKLGAVQIPHAFDGSALAAVHSRRRSRYQRRQCVAGIQLTLRA